MFSVAFSMWVTVGNSTDPRSFIGWSTTSVWMTISLCSQNQSGLAPKQDLNKRTVVSSDQEGHEFYNNPCLDFVAMGIFFFPLRKPFPNSFSILEQIFPNYCCLYLWWCHQQTNSQCSGCLAAVDFFPSGENAIMWRLSYISSLQHLVVFPSFLLLIVTSIQWLLFPIMSFSGELTFPLVNLGIRDKAEICSKVWSFHEKWCRTFTMAHPKGGVWLYLFNAIHKMQREPQTLCLQAVFHWYLLFSGGLKLSSGIECWKCI